MFHDRVTLQTKHRKRRLTGLGVTHSSIFHEWVHSVQNTQSSVLMAPRRARGWPAPRGLVEHAELPEVAHLGFHTPAVASQHISTTSYHVSDHVQY
jgi:hypothetical protein